MFRILFVGDIVGRPGRRAVREIIPVLREKHKIDFVIANGENSAHGACHTVKTTKEIFSSGVDAITSGDHLWDNNEVSELLKNEPRFFRPLNYPLGVEGCGAGYVTTPKGIKVGIINLQGRTFMKSLENPFHAGMEAAQRLRRETPIIFVDFHAEATAEKISMGRYLDGHVSVVVGTHTHVQTADESIFPKGTAYLTDAGFTGPHEGVIGREAEDAIHRFLTSEVNRLEIGARDLRLQGAMIDINETTGKAIKIQRISECVVSFEEQIRRAQEAAKSAAAKSAV